MKIKEISHRNFQNDPDYYSLHWAITNNCNYHCDYCGVYKNEKIYDFEKTIEFINYVDQFKNVDTVLFGGEPLIHPNILEIVKGLKTNIRICTNLSIDLQFFKQLTDINNNLKIVASYHLHKEDLESFVDKFRYLANHTNFIKVKIMFDSRYKEQCKNVYYFFKAFEHQYQNCKIYLDMVYHEICDFSDQDIKFFESKQNDDDRFYIRTDEGERYTSYNEIRRMYNGFPIFYGYECDSGKSGMFIDSDGSVYPCQTKRNNRLSLFNLNIDDYKDHWMFINSSRLCDQNQPCYEVVIPRRIND